MYQLFQEQPNDPAGGYVFPDFRRVQAGLQHSIRKVQEYRRSNPAGLNGSHYLIRLLHSLNVPMSLPTHIYNDRVSDITFNLGMAMRMTSVLSRGRVFAPGPFYGRNMAELIIANIDPYDIDAGEQNWENLEPIRVLYHPLTDLQINVPDSRFDTEEAGTAVITINVPMLAVQYRAWRKWMAATIKDESPRSIMQFLMTFPLPNMLRSHVDIAVMNRTINQYFGVPMPQVRSRNPFYLTDWTPNVDRGIEAWLAYANNRKWSFDTMLSNMPVVAHRNMHEVIRLPEMAYSQQIQWTIIVARLALVTFLVQFGAGHQNVRNSQALNVLRRYLRHVQSIKTLENAMPTERFEEVSVLINRGIVPYL